MLVTAEFTCDYWIMHRGNCICLVLSDIVNMCIIACVHACVRTCVRVLITCVRMWCIWRVEPKFSIFVVEDVCLYICIYVCM